MYKKERKKKSENKFCITLLNENNNKKVTTRNKVSIRESLNKNAKQRFFFRNFFFPFCIFNKTKSETKKKNKVLV